MKASANCIFVYGSLLGGRNRCSVWPHPADLVTPACLEAVLYDLGPYPAIVAGTGNWVYGELHQFSDTTQWEQTIVALDEFEEFNPMDPVDSLYTREFISIHTEVGTSEGFAYFLNAPRLTQQLGSKYPIIPPSEFFLGRYCSRWKLNSEA